MKKFKFVSMFLTFLLLMSCFTSSLAIEQDQTVQLLSQKHNSEEKIKVIIELFDESIIDHSVNQNLNSKEFIQSSQAKALRKKLVGTQKQVQEQISKQLNYAIEYKHNYTYTFNGFAAKIHALDLDKIKALPNVKDVYVDVKYERPTPDMTSATDITYAPLIWDLDYKGEGTVVAVIDTGIDPNHELMVLSDDSTATLTKDSIAAVLGELNAKEIKNNLTVDGVYQSAKMPYTFDYADSDTDATVGNSEHGVHVSGIIGANMANCPEQFNGVAPEAQIIGMKVFSDAEDGAYSSDIFAAVEDSVTLGVDVMNLSLGSPAGFTKYVGYKELDSARIYDNARKAGVIAMISAGNEDHIGAGGNYMGYPTTKNTDTALVGSPSSNYSATSVASMENTFQNSKYIYSASLDRRIVYADISEDNPDGQFPFIETLSGSTYEYVYCGIGEEEDFEGKNLDGKIALISRGAINFSDKVANAAIHGAIGAIVFNNRDEDRLVNMSGTETQSIPSCFIFMEDGIALFNAEVKEITVDNELIGLVPNKTAGQMSGFTSWGPNPDLSFKPEVTAPGGKIYSTISNNEYAVMSGTSMAAPHAAGGAALVKQYINEKFSNLKDTKKAELVENLIMSTSRVMLDPDYYQYSPRRQGSGLLNLYGAINTEAYLLNKKTGKAKVELKDKLGDEYKVTFDVINFSDETRNYELQGSALTEQPVGWPYSENEYVTFPNALIISSEMTYKGESINVVSDVSTSSAIITDGEATIEVKPNSKATITINVKLDSEYTDALSSIYSNGFFVEGFIELLALDEGEPNLSIPYMGYYGEWDAAPIVDSFLLYDGSSFYFNYNNYYYGGLMYSPSNGSILGIDFNGMTDYNYITITPNGDGKEDDITANIALLRNARNIAISIKDADNKLIKKLSSDDYYRKEAYDAIYDMISTTDFTDGGTWDGTDKKGNVVENGQYYYEIVANIDYKNSTPQTYQIPVFLDTAKPKMTSCFITNKEDRKLLNIVLEDNGTMGYVEFYNNVDELFYEDTEDIMTDNVKSFIIDVTNDENITIVCSDLGENILSQKLNIQYIEDNPLVGEISIDDTEPIRLISTK
ncbi:S8 family serine peptidase [Sedimentibacter sp. zth1]|uniref:S8 family serine peptidase n=1 Tax=Sedimentibacter sp. zth1 TaxID=2816908 RepID=UPI001A910FE3|nr:S8 family serine peptidase [Sedimentibacter sp. zth1]QSX06324.1 S8 family serine peptidase [Sedimentibacter sp. zth1]